MTAPKESDYTCGTCWYYNGETWCCDLHLECGEVHEDDTCDDWTDPDEVEPTEDEKRANAGCDEAHRIMVEGRRIL